MGSNPTLSASRAFRRNLALLLFIPAVLVPGCSLLRQPPYLFEGTFPAQGNLAALPIRVFDHSGTVTAIEIPVGPPGRPANAESDTFAVAVPGRPNSVAVVWLGGACDDQVDLEYTGGDTTFTVTTVRRAGICEAVGIIRSVIVVFLAPVDALNVRVQDMS